MPKVLNVILIDVDQTATDFCELSVREALLRSIRSACVKPGDLNVVVAFTARTFWYFHEHAIKKYFTLRERSSEINGLEPHEVFMCIRAEGTRAYDMGLVPVHAALAEIFSDCAVHISTPHDHFEALNAYVPDARLGYGYAHVFEPKEREFQHLLETYATVEEDGVVMKATALAALTTFRQWYMTHEYVRMVESRELHPVVPNVNDKKATQLRFVLDTLITHHDITSGDSVSVHYYDDTDANLMAAKPVIAMFRETYPDIRFVLTMHHVHAVEGHVLSTVYDRQLPFSAGTAAGGVGSGRSDLFAARGRAPEVNPATGKPRSFSR
jgi:hypothetical protein